MDNQYNCKVKLSELFYCLFFASLLFAKGIGLYDGQKAFKLILVGAGICWAAKMIMTEFSKKELMAVFLILFLGMIVYRVSGDKGFLLYAMMVTGAKDIPLKRIFTVGMITWLLSFGMMFFLTATHLVDSPFKVHEKGGELIIRWGLGSTHPNVLHVSYLVLCMFAGYLLDEKMNLKWLLLLVAGNLYVFIYSVSFTGFIAVSFYLVLCTYWMVRKKISLPEHILIKGGAAFCVLFSMLGPLLIKGRIFEMINRILNTRWRLSMIYLTKYPYSLFGRRISDIVTYTSTMDCSYVYAYVAYGLVAFLLLVAGYILIIHRYCREQKGKELCMILASLAAGVTEPFLFNTSFKNIPLLFFRDLLYSGRQDGKRISFLQKHDKTVIFSSKKFAEAAGRIGSGIRKTKRRIPVILFLAFAVGAIAYKSCAVPPERIVVPRSESDLDESWYTELELSQGQIKEGDIVYGKIEEDTVLLGLKGKAIDWEILRNTVTSGILTGGMALIIITIHGYLKGKENDR